MEFIMHPIGVIHTPFSDPAQTPTQPIHSQAVGQVEVFPEYARGLDDLSRYPYIYLLFAFHLSAGYSLEVHPQGVGPLRGLFATRSPRRPNPIGLSVVKLLSCQGNTLEVKGVDMLDGTPNTSVTGCCS